MRMCEKRSESGPFYKPNLCIDVSSFLCFLSWSLVKSTLKSSFSEFWYNGPTFFTPPGHMHIVSRFRHRAASLTI